MQVTNFVLSFGTPFATILYLIVFQAAGGLDSNLSTVWRVVFGISMIPREHIFPVRGGVETDHTSNAALAVFGFRLRMLNSKLYRKSAIQNNVPYKLVFRYYWRSLIGTCGAWFLYDFVVFPNGVFSGTIIASIVKVRPSSLPSIVNI
jgi:hypothetical protein